MFIRGALAVFFLAGSINVFSEEYKVGMAGWEFKPAHLSISVGDTVIWINDDDTKHKLSFEDESLLGPTKSMPHKFDQNDRFAFKFIKSGSFKYVCTTHEDQDMVGLIIVKGK